VPAVIVAVVVAAALLLLLGEPAPAAAAAGAPFGFTAFALAFMKQYWFHFELATVLLLVGIVAAWTVIRESR